MSLPENADRGMRHAVIRCKRVDVENGEALLCFIKEAIMLVFHPSTGCIIYKNCKKIYISTRDFTGELTILCATTLQNSKETRSFFFFFILAGALPRCRGTAISATCARVYEC